MIRMPRSDSGSTAERIRPISPCFDALYAGLLDRPRMPPVEPVTTMAPPGRIALTALRMPRKQPRRLIAMMRSNAETSSSKKLVPGP